MPMIDIYAVTGTFGNKHELAKDAANAVMRWEQVPTISLFQNNTAAFGPSQRRPALIMVCGT